MPSRTQSTNMTLLILVQYFLTMAMFWMNPPPSLNPQLSMTLTGGWVITLSLGINKETM